MSARFAALIAGLLLSFAPIGCASALGSEAERPAYVLPDGSISIVAGERLAPLLTRLNALFLTMHPEYRITLTTPKSEVATMQAFAAGVTPFAVMDRESWGVRVEDRPFLQTRGYAPTDIRFGRVGYFAPGRPHPPAVYVNVDNPISALTLAQVAAIFTTGHEGGDVTHWGQVGLADRWRDHRIHSYGPPDNGYGASALRGSRMKGYPFNPNYEAQSDDAAIIAAVAGDIFGIAIVDHPVAVQAQSPRVRMVPLADTGGAAPSAGTHADVAAGRYPLSPFLHLYVDRKPGQPLDPFVEAYARMLLSDAGQAIVAAEASDGSGLVPLTPAEVAAELSGLR
ncbi:MAG: substrate-binding domain-containing protein [Sphingomonadales bacterium]|nr:substrate-binding domain-containing protein [Sphingomonadales bacterium]